MTTRFQPRTTRHTLLAIGLCWAGLTTTAWAAAESTGHKAQDIAKHRAIAAAHEAAAQCLESGKEEETCHKALRAACTGLAIGKYCGMRHEH